MILMRYTEEPARGGLYVVTGMEFSGEGLTGMWLMHVLKVARVLFSREKKLAGLPGFRGWPRSS